MCRSAKTLAIVVDSSISAWTMRINHIRSIAFIAPIHWCTLSFSHSRVRLSPALPHTPIRSIFLHSVLRLWAFRLTCRFVRLWTVGRITNVQRARPHQYTYERKRYTRSRKRAHWIGGAVIEKQTFCPISSNNNKSVCRRQWDYIQWNGRVPCANGMPE